VCWRSCCGVRASPYGLRTDTANFHQSFPASSPLHNPFQRILGSKVPPVFTRKLRAGQRLSITFLYCLGRLAKLHCLAGRGRPSEFAVRIAGMREINAKNGSIWPIGGYNKQYGIGRWLIYFLSWSQKGRYRAEKGPF